VWFSVSQFSPKQDPWSPVKESRVYREHLTSTILTHHSLSPEIVTLQAPNQLPLHLGLSLIYTGRKCMTSDRANFVVVYLRVWCTVKGKTKWKNGCKATNATRSHIRRRGTATVVRISVELSVTMTCYFVGFLSVQAICLYWPQSSPFLCLPSHHSRQYFHLFSATKLMWLELRENICYNNSV
jgi:hypothetical protein